MSTQAETNSSFVNKRPPTRVFFHIAADEYSSGGGCSESDLWPGPTSALGVRRRNGGGRGVKQFSQSCNPVSCPGPHNLHRSGGLSERDGPTAERTESPSVWQPHPRRGSAKALPRAALQLRYHSPPPPPKNGFG